MDRRLVTTTAYGDAVVSLLPAATDVNSGAAAAGANTSLAAVAATLANAYVYAHATPASGAPSGS
jgi:hypothetical protein